MNSPGSSFARRGSMAARWLRAAGTLACLVALLTTVGGHWVVLQSLAWGKMIVEFSRQSSLTEALSKTFDGQHPCSLCRKVQLGQQQEREAQRRHPLLRMEHLPDFLPTPGRVSAPPRLSAPAPHTPFVATRHAEFVSSPPKPPPRAA